FAKRIEKEAADKAPGEQIAHGYKLMLFKEMPAAKQQVFVRLYQEALDDFSKNEKNIGELMGGDKKENYSAASAAMVIVANALLNLDEVVMK
ncbi:MAG TPA: hypothetical protein PKC69_00295, partial [Chitinophagaceae bacterium]|nr:hypothetical protein [Chitinophagaceae bacterium]